MHINLLDPAAYAEGQPYAQFKWLRENKPVFWHPEPGQNPGFWAVTRYADARTILSNPQVFSSWPSVSLDDHASHGDGDHREVIFSDPPGHTDHRAFLQPELSLPSVKTITGIVEDLVAEIIDEVIEHGECDLVSDLSGKLASWTIADLLGLPRPEIVALYDATDRLLNSIDRTQGDGLKAAHEILNYVDTTWSDRRSSPREDFVSRLAHGEFGGKKVDKKQFSLDLLVLIAAGGDTTRNAFSGGMSELFKHPDQQAAVGADPELVRKAVEEMLRWVSPICYQRRTTTEATEIAGQPIAKGQRVVVWAGASNRDPTVFADPDRFDVRRSPNAHMTFGFGAHHCLGSHLARLELTTMVREVLRRMPDLRPAGPTVWLHGHETNSPQIVGPKRMPVRFTPGRRVRKNKTAA